MIQYALMRREKVDGRVVVVHERGDGIRRRYRESLDTRRWTFPRKGLIHHPREWYLFGDGPRARPVFGVYAMAAFAEDTLWRAFHARKGMKPSVEDATVFFAETRRALQNVLSTYRIDRRLTAAQVRSLRFLVDRLQVSAQVLVGKMEPVGRQKGETDASK